MIRPCTTSGRAHSFAQTYSLRCVTRSASGHDLTHVRSSLVTDNAQDGSQRHKLFIYGKICHVASLVFFSGATCFLGCGEENEVAELGAVRQSDKAPRGSSVASSSSDKPAEPPATAQTPAISVSGEDVETITHRKPLRHAFDVDAPCTVEGFEVELRGEHSYYADVWVLVRDPHGQRYTLQDEATRNPFRAYKIRRARGTEAQGSWQLEVRDRRKRDDGILRGWRIRIWCHPDDVK